MAKQPDFHISHPSPARANVSPLRLLGAATLTPLAWFGQESVSYFGSSETCWLIGTPFEAPSMTILWIALLLANLGFVVVGLFGFYLAYTCWMRSRGEKSGGKEETIQVGEGRTRFSALSAMIISGIFFVAIFAEACALFIFQNCAGASGT